MRKLGWTSATLLLLTAPAWAQTGFSSLFSRVDPSQLQNVPIDTSKTVAPVPPIPSPFNQPSPSFLSRCACLFRRCPQPASATAPVQDPFQPQLPIMPGSSSTPQRGFQFSPRPAPSRGGFFDQRHLQ